MFRTAAAVNTEDFSVSVLQRLTPAAQLFASSLKEGFVDLAGLFGLHSPGVNCAAQKASCCSPADSGGGSMGAWQEG